MELNEIIAALDDEIGRLQKARKLLGRTHGRLTQTTSSAFNAKEKKVRRKRRKRHNLSAEGREMIAAAQRKRWAAQKQKRIGK